MEIVILSHEPIKSKKNGAEYDKFTGVDKSGKAVELFLNRDQTTNFQLTDKLVATSDQVAKLFDELPVVEVFFNQQGRVDKVTV